MKRWHEDLRITLREWKRHRNSHVESNIDLGKPNPFEVDCSCDDQIGRFRKMRAFDCGQTECYACHYEKLNNEPNRQEIRSNQSFKEQLEEFFEI